MLSPVYECTVTSRGEIKMVRYAAWHVLCVGEFFFASHPLANCSLLPNSFSSILFSVIQTILLLVLDFNVLILDLDEYSERNSW